MQERLPGGEMMPAAGRFFNRDKSIAFDIPVLEEDEHFYTFRDGERRLNLDTPEIQDTLVYIDGCLDKFMVKADVVNEPLLQELREIPDVKVETMDDLRRFLISTKLIRFSKDGRIYLPNDYLAPNDQLYGRQQYYWDSLWHIKWLLAADRAETAKGTIDNLDYMQAALGHTPNSNLISILGHSQPPLRTTMIGDVKAALPDSAETDAWYKEKIEIAKIEYWEVWNNLNDLKSISGEPVHNHCIEGTILRGYGNREIKKYPFLVELETGHDMGPRFQGRADEFLAVDLNAYLAKYEADFERAALYFGDTVEAELWRAIRTLRVSQMYRSMYNPEEKYWYDVDTQGKEDKEQWKQGPVESLAGMTTMWAGIVMPEHHIGMVDKLGSMSTHIGLMATNYHSIPGFPIRKVEQHNAPNRWAHIEQQAVEALIDNGFYDEAIQIMENAVVATAQCYKATGSLPEKMDEVTGELGSGAHYENQLGFGWTNAVFVEYVNRLPKLYYLRDEHRARRHALSHT